MAIVVTGGAGFIGSHFVERLLRDTSENIVCFDSFNNYYNPALKRANVAAFQDNPRVSLVEDSFCRWEAVRSVFLEHKVSAVVHLGGYAGVRASFQQPRLYEEANVRGTLNLLEAARQFGVRRFVMASSSTVYGLNVPAPFQEDLPLGTPGSPYAASKRAAELHAKRYNQMYRLPVVILRPFSVYGPRARPDLAVMAFANAITEGRALTLFGDGTVLRDFTYIEDICDGFSAALESRAAIGQAINLGNNRPVEIRELISLLESSLGERARIEYRPAAPGDMDVTCADLTKAERLLGYRPRVALAEGIQRFVDWVFQRRNLAKSLDDVPSSNFDNHLIRKAA